MEQYRIFNSDGFWLEQLRTSVVRAWTLVSETSAKFVISCKDPKCNPFVLNFGNILLAENSDGLPPWVGMIDFIQFDKGNCIVTAYTPERFFNYRYGPRKLTLKGTAGQIFSQMINNINTTDRTVLTVGDIFSNTGPMEETLNPVSLKNNLKRIVDRSGEGYRWRPVVSGGQLIIFCDWYPSLILDTGLILQDGYNVSGNHPLSLSAPINDYLAYGNGAEWEKRLMSVATDYESAQQYGTRQASVSVNTKSPETLAVTARRGLSRSKQPSYSYPLEALNEGDTFARLSPGALATFVKLVGQGFGNNGIGHFEYNKVIQSLSFDPQDGPVGLAI